MPAKQYKYRFTLFTPCYNSAKFMERIKSSVEGQTFKNFEWIVVNDNSSDNTLELLHEYIKTVNFPVKLINNKTNMMLAVNYNLAVEQTEGEYFVTLDHDDEYSPRYLEIMDELIKRYDSPKVAGVVARCQTQYGKITPTPAYTQPLMNWFEYGHDKNGRFTGEVPRAFKTDILYKYTPFDPKEVHNPLIEAMMSYDGYTFITTNEVIRKYYVEEEYHESITRGVARLKVWMWRNAFKEIELYTKRYHTSPVVKAKLCVDYWTASKNMDMLFHEAFSEIHHLKCYVLLFYPIAMLKHILSHNKFLHDRWRKHRNKRIKAGN